MTGIWSTKGKNDSYLIIPNQDLTRQASRYNQWNIGAWISDKSLKTKEDQMCWLFPSGVSIFVARKNAPLADKICSSILNSSNIEQMGYNRDGRLPLEVAKIWNESFDRVM